MPKRFQVTLPGKSVPDLRATQGGCSTSAPLTEDVYADEWELYDGVLVFRQYQEYGKPSIVAMAYAVGAWLTFQEVED